MEKFLKKLKENEKFLCQKQVKMVIYKLQAVIMQKKGRDNHIIVSEQDKYLIQLLKSLGLDKTTTIDILAILKTPENKDEFLDKIAYNTNKLTEQDILKKVAEICKKGKIT